MPHNIKPLPFKPPRLIGFSEDSVVSHYENHYGAHVRQFNMVESELASLNWTTATRSIINGLMHEKMNLINSVVLHEVYFDSLGGEDGLGSPSIDPTGDLSEAINKDFGSVANWRNEFSAMGAASIGGSGWVILQWNGLTQRLENVMAANHSQMIAYSTPILSMDLFEHAYLSDFQHEVTLYIDAFLANIHWGRPAARFNAVVRSPESPNESVDDQAFISPEDLFKSMSGEDAPVLLDVCLVDDIPSRHDQLSGAVCVKSDEVAQSIGALSKDKPIVVYCMYGFQVSDNAVKELRALGFEAHGMAGGISGWRAMGGITVPYKP